ncbi:hypothetical protein PAXRUDRAFT_425527 [Paxillus rubicundulus Ve08.2h10]|uniref:Uncharacterized protein n=1 Tax=Paxillus rubicundulus Ve08.2h10 TaxID=930991 RepID=A0A0D0E8B9_9AGAM|nr:hypothetical protein PAXRUDRAFT_425527 [Paxillus rubicundulus Ve08.2h10]
MGWAAARFHSLKDSVQDVFLPQKLRSDGTTCIPCSSPYGLDRGNDPRLLTASMFGMSQRNWFVTIRGLVVSFPARPDDRDLEADRA